jgi:hypothetical protein
MTYPAFQLISQVELGVAHWRFGGLPWPIAKETSEKEIVGFFFGIDLNMSPKCDLNPCTSGLRAGFHELAHDIWQKDFISSFVADVFGEPHLGGASQKSYAILKTET